MSEVVDGKSLNRKETVNRILITYLKICDCAEIALFASISVCSMLSIMFVLFSGADMAYPLSIMPTPNLEPLIGLIAVTCIVILLRDRINSRVRWAVVLTGSISSMILFALDWPGLGLFGLYLVASIGGCVYAGLFQKTLELNGDPL